MAVHRDPEPRRDATPAAPARDRGDVLVRILLVGATLGYLARWPHDLYHFDEGLFLYEAKRIVHGDVLYRDLFELVTPAAWYLMALVFAVFGVGMTVARLAMAVVHATNVALIHVACRRMGVRQSLSLLAALAYLPLCFPAFPIATPHWLGTCLTLALLVSLLGTPGARASRWGLAPGVLAGVLVLVQQHKGVIVAAGVCTIWLASRVIRSRSEFRLDTFSLPRFITGIVVVTVPVLSLFLALAGPATLFNDLVVHPLVYYPSYNRTSWGQESVFVYTTVFPRLVTYIPLVIPLGVMGVALRIRRASPRAEGLLVATGFAIFAVLSILYYPDITHLVLAAPVWFVLTAALLEAAVAWAASRAVDVFAAVLAVLVGARLVAGMAANVEMRRKLYPFSATTPIGTVDFVDDQEFRASETVRALVRRDGVEEIFAYPYYASIYLLTETRNATRYQVLLPRYNTDDEIREAIDDLERKKVAYVVVGLALNWNWQDDPVMIYVRSHYDRIPLPTATKARLPSFMLFGRRPAA